MPAITLVLHFLIDIRLDATGQGKKKTYILEELGRNKVIIINIT